MKSKTVQISSVYRAAGLGLLALLGGATSGYPQSAAGVFNTRCSSCHSFGKGDHIGPDLKAVTARRSRAWLIDWIQSSEAKIRSGDATARALYKKYGGQRMPDFDLPVETITALLDYLESGGPAAADARELRDAATATGQEMLLGEQLFEGRVALASGATACVSCHTVASRGALGGTLGPDLTGTYTKYRDRGLRQFLQRACFTRRPFGHGRNDLTAAESFALRAFLRASDPSTRPLARTGDAGSAGPGQ
jgi:cytochrome c2